MAAEAPLAGSPMGISLHGAEIISLSASAGETKAANQLLEAFAGITWNETLHYFRCAVFSSVSVQTLKCY